ncbi:MAG: hypothetical protein KF876_13400 [Nitrospira sp.]|nr:hypothetical protein [Nitrospira sp.]
MRGKSMMVIGFLAMVAVTGVIDASSGLASDLGQIAVTERIGHGGSTYQPQFESLNDCRMKMDRVERIGAGGSTYASSRSTSTQAQTCQAAKDGQKRVDVIERIGAGGSTYFSNQTMS